MTAKAEWAARTEEPVASFSASKRGKLIGIGLSAKHQGQRSHQTALTGRRHDCTRPAKLKYHLNHLAKRAPSRHDDANQAATRINDPLFDVRVYLLSDHRVEPIDQIPSFEQGRNTCFDRGNCDCISPAKVIASRRHLSRDRSGRRYPLKLLIGGLLGTPPSGRPFADDAQTAMKASPAQLSPKLCAIALPRCPELIQQWKVLLDRALAGTEHSVLRPRTIWRTVPRLWPVRRTISLIAMPSVASLLMMALASSRRR